MSGLELLKFKNCLQNREFIQYRGKVSQLVGLTIEANGPAVSIGEVCEIVTGQGLGQGKILAEAVGFRDNKVLLMPLGEMGGIGPGSHVLAAGKPLTVPVGPGLIGRVLDGLGNPIDGKGPLQISMEYPVSSKPPHPMARKRINKPLALGVKAIDGLLTLGKGQRVGIFAGSGVGKSTLMGMIARNTAADINIIALIGERGREVREFLEKDLGEEGLKRSVVVVATSDQPALVRLKGAMIATAIGEYFRDQGKDVLLLMDSLTRFAMAQREIGLAIGEPPVSRGYTPSVFALLPKLLERAGNSDTGSITGLYTVLVDGDDLTEPVTDTARGILDGHIVLSRNLVNRAHYPAIDILASISRVMGDITDREHRRIAGEIKKNMAIYRDAEDLINIGAYVKGSNDKIDCAIDVMDDILAFVRQDVEECCKYDDTLETMKSILRE